MMRRKNRTSRQILKASICLCLFGLLALASVTIPSFSSSSLSSASSATSRRLADDDGDDCGKVRNRPASEQCQWVRDNCGDVVGVFDYMAMRYCTLPHAAGFVYTVIIIWLILLFVMLGDTADQYFTGSLERITESLKLSPNVAGVTFLALGNGAPDISSIVAAVLVSGASDIGIGEPIGSGMFITTVIMGLVTMVADVKVTRRPFLRDVLMYLASVIYACLTAIDGTFSLAESISFLVLYIVYVIIVIVGRMVYQRWKKRRLAADGNEVARSDPAAVQSNVERALAHDKHEHVHAHAHTHVHAPHRHVVYMVHGNALEEEREEEERSSTTVGESAPLIGGKPSGVAQSTAVAVGAPFSAGPSAVNNIQDAQSSTDMSEDMIYEKSLLGLWRRWVDFIEWEDKNLFEKILFPFVAPFRLLLLFTIPQVEHDCFDRFFASCSFALFPLMIMFAANMVPFLIGVFPLVVIFLLLTVPLSVVIYFFLPARREPKGFVLLCFVFLCFAMSIVWIYLFANELVVVLQSLGFFFGISPSLMALTVLAIGNSVGDLVADILVARNGYPQMAIAAIYAGPMLNLLIGVGLAFTILNAINYPQPASLVMNESLYVSFFTLLVSLLSALIVLPLNKWRSPRWYGICLLILYFVATLFSVLFAFNVLSVS
eukprot:ANDGO_05313.mRNA.1 Putative sodium/calcium exchanger 6